MATPCAKSVVAPGPVAPFCLRAPMAMAVYSGMWMLPGDTLLLVDPPVARGQEEGPAAPAFVAKAIHQAI